MLKKEEDILHTAWWYDDGTTKTIDEWEWRWATLSKQSRFRLVNITAATKDDLYELADSWLKKH